MLKWMLAAVGIFALSMAISAGSMRLYDASSRRPYDPQAHEFARQISLQYEPVSLVALLANPERYDGRRVFVSGFVSLEFEDCGLHLDRTAYEAGLQRNAIWLDRPKWLNSRDTQRLSQRYADVAGTFEASGRGHMGSYSGTLTQLRLIDPTYTMADYRQLELRESRVALIQQLLSGWFLTFVGWVSLWMYWALTRRPL